jgi:hypothetical protein
LEHSLEQAFERSQIALHQPLKYEIVGGAWQTCAGDAGRWNDFWKVLLHFA